MCSPLCTAESRRRRPAAEAVPGSLAEVVLPVAMRLAGGLPREEARTRERRVAPQRAVEQQEAQARRCLAEEPPRAGTLPRTETRERRTRGTPMTAGNLWGTTRRLWAGTTPRSRTGRRTW